MLALPQPLPCYQRGTLLNELMKVEWSVVRVTLSLKLTWQVSASVFGQQRIKLAPLQGAAPCSYG